MSEPRVTVHRRLGAVTVEGPGELLRAWEPQRGVVLQTMQGRISLQGARAILEVREAAIERAGKIVIGADNEQARAYDPAVRALIDGWMLDHRDAIVVQHMLLRSNLLKMAIELTNLAAGSQLIVAHTEREEFERCLLEAVPGLDLGRMRECAAVATRKASA